MNTWPSNTGRTIGLLIVLGCAYTAPPIWAAAEDSTALQEITVTAQRRSESAQSAPLVITALAGDSLLSQGVSNITQLSNTIPNVSIGIAAGVPHLAMRGIGTTATLNNAEADAAFSVDGFLVGRPEATVDALFDVQRIEVLLGPQGTLYGRNSTSGAVNVITRDPTPTLDYYSQLTLGNFQTINFEGGIGGPISDIVSARVAVQSLNHGGYGTQGNGAAMNDLHSNAVRAKVKVEPTTDLSVLLSASATKQDDATSTYQFARPGDFAPVVASRLGGVFARDIFYDTNSDFPSRLYRDDKSVGLTVNWRISQYATLTSLTGYSTMRYWSQDDYDSTQLNLTYLRTHTDDDQFTQEVRVGGTIGQFNYVLGGFYLDDRLVYDNVLPINALLLGGPDQMLQGYHGQGTLYTYARAVFGQLSYEFTDWLGVDAGMRYSQESKAAFNDGLAFDLVTPFDPSLTPKWLGFIPRNDVSNHAFTPKATLRLKPAEDVLLYATYAKGFNSGGINIGAAQEPYQPEDLKDYEIGMKSLWFDRRLQVNLSAFDYLYTNLQTQVQVSGNTGALVTVNAGRARIYGAEASLAAKVMGSLTVDADIGVLRSRYLVFGGVDSTNPNGAFQNLRGYELPNAPGYTARLGAQYSIKTPLGEFAPRFEGVFVGKTYFTPFHDPASTQDAYARCNAQLNFKPNMGSWSASLFVENLGNSREYAALSPTTILLGGYAEGAPMPPRTYGVRILKASSY